jgi:hypothetical protein
MSKKRHYEVISPDGTTCPRCGVEAETRKHTTITDKQLRQPFYFKRWYNCTNTECKTGIFMLDDWKVINKNGAAFAFEAKKEFGEQMTFLRSI